VIIRAHGALEKEQAQPFGGAGFVSRHNVVFAEEATNTLTTRTLRL
jgi:hypothetical protein